MVYSFKLAVFDLDDTLWNGEELFRDTKNILTTLKSNGIPIYIASFHTGALDACKSLNIDIYFNDILFGRDKTKHQMIMDILKKHPDIQESDVVFYDDNLANICDVQKNSQIQTVHIGPDGLQWYHVNLFYYVSFNEFPDFFSTNYHLSDYARIAKALC
jgi:FMN phosphatase YigB (HAD superfamily)